MEANLIKILDDMPAGVLGAKAEGKITAEDYTKVLVPALTDATKNGKKLRVLLDFTAGFTGMEPSAVWQDMKTGVHEWRSWERIALVTDHLWMADGVRLFSWAIPGQARAFGSTERQAALDWLTAP
jgi:hypothetical protein